MNQFKMTFAVAIFMFSLNVNAGQGIALTWKNKHGKWFACGPVQCTWSSDETEEKSLSYVINDRKHSIQNSHQTFGRCKIYLVDNVDDFEYDAEKVKSLAKC